MGTIRSMGVAVALAVVAMTATGERSARAEEKAATVMIGRQAKAMGEQLVLKLDMFDWDTETGDVFGMGEGLGYAADLHVDIRRRRAHVSLGAGDPSVVYLRLDARLWPDHGSMRTSVTLRVGIAGERLQLSLPDVRVKTRVAGGELVYELNVPLIEGRF
jgi:hypothetical protein